MFRRSRVTIAVAAVGMLISAAAGAQEYPTKPITLIVPWPAGGSTDISMRAIAESASKLLGQPIAIDNKAGGGGTVGPATMAAAAKSDGYTIAQIPITVFRLPLMQEVSWNPDKDFTYIVHLTGYTFGVTTSAESPFKTWQDVIDYAKQNPGKLMNASSSNGSPGHVGGELFKFMTGTDIVHVPYRGGANAINDLIAGRVHLMFESLNSIAPHAGAGTVRALGVSGARRSPAFPDLPTIAEAGVPGYEAPTWSGVIAPAGVPRPILDKLNAAINRAVVSPAFRERFAAIGDEPAGGTPEEFAQQIRKDSTKWAEVIARSGAKLD